MMTMSSLLNKWDWRAIANCSGRYVLQARTDLQVQDIVGEPILVVEFTLPTARDKVLVARMEEGGLISYLRKDGSIRNMG